MAVSRILVISATDAEATAIQAGLADSDRVRVVVCGVGPAAAAATTVRELTSCGELPHLVVAAGIGGGQLSETGDGYGALVVAQRIVFADLAIGEADGSFTPVADAGLGRSEWSVQAAPELAGLLSEADRPVTVGTIVTVSATTGTDVRAAELCKRWGPIAAEGMEGAGVATAGTVCGVPFAEVRAVSNQMGVRRRELWRIDLALAALTEAGRLLGRAAHDWNEER